MVDLGTILLMSLIILVALLIKSMTGFAEGLVMVPLLLLFLDIKFILPITLVLILFGDIFLLYNFKKNINKKIILILLISSILGVIFGSYLLNILNSSLIKIIFAIFIIIFSIKMLFFDKIGKKIKISKFWGNIAGFFGGLIDALFGTGGPPVVIYLNQIGLKKAAFRATCVMTFFIFHVGRLVTYSYSGLINFDTIKISVYLIPAMIIGSVIGMKIHLKLNELLFKRIVAIILLIIGIVLIL